MSTQDSVKSQNRGLDLKKKPEPDFNKRNCAIHFKPFIELSDGWYPIRAQCDSYLANYLKSKRLTVGDKIAIYSSEMVGCPKDGCPPLEVGI